MRNLSTPTPNLSERARATISEAWALFRNPEVAFWYKLIPIASIVYIITPVDIVPELWFPIVGYVDDVTVFILSLNLFLFLAKRARQKSH
ncbi:MAG: DUF1232 domain-containing protein [Candidatus Roizmanbacteria bacterium]